MKRWNSWLVLALSPICISACADTGNSDLQDAGHGSDAARRDQTTDRADTAGEANACELPEAEPPSCEACLASECEQKYMACYCDASCGQWLEAVRDCFKSKHTFENPSPDPLRDLSLCEEAVGDGSPPDDRYDDLLSCVSAAWEPPADDAEEDAYGRTAGDGSCTSACFELFSFDE